MPWKKHYTASDEISPAGVIWPQGKKAAVTILVDYSVPCGPEGITPQVVAEAEALWGSAVRGEWLLDFLDERRAPATFSVPFAMAEAFPHIVRGLASTRHEIAAGSFCKENADLLPPEEELRRMRETFAGLEAITGKRPCGWFSLPRATDDFPSGSMTPYTLDALRDLGCGYFGNSMADDIPHYWASNVNEAARSLLCLPYHYALDAQFFVFFPGFGRGSGLMQTRNLLENWLGELQGAVRYGRQAVLVIQPYLMRCHAAKSVLVHALNAIQKDDNLWITTSAQCAEYWRTTFPPETSLRLHELRCENWT